MQTQKTLLVHCHFKTEEDTFHRAMVDQGLSCLFATAGTGAYVTDSSNCSTVVSTGHMFRPNVADYELTTSREVMAFPNLPATVVTSRSRSKWSVDEAIGGPRADPSPKGTGGGGCSRVGGDLFGSCHPFHSIEAILTPDEFQRSQQQPQHQRERGCSSGIEPASSGVKSCVAENTAHSRFSTTG